MTARSYICTLNNPTVSVSEYFNQFMKKLDVRYICGQLERGE